MDQIQFYRRIVAVRPQPDAILVDRGCLVKTKKSNGTTGTKQDMNIKGLRIS